MKPTFIVITLFLTLSSFISHPIKKTDPPSKATASYTTVVYTNSSGKDLVIALSQGALIGQNANQTNWLKFDTSTSTYKWELPTPTTASDLAPYIFSLNQGDSLTIQVPSYTAAVGFRSLVADTVYRQQALRYVDGNLDSAAYMAFPDMNTDTFLFDKFEAGLTIGFPGVWNITAVDFVAIPMQLEANGMKVGFKDGVTTAGLYSVLNNLGTPYNQGDQITPNSASHVYRFFSPANISAANTALDSTIKQQIPTINGSAIVKYGNYVFTNLTGSVTTDSSGQVVGTVSASYTCSACKVTSPRQITVNDVTTSNAFAGTIVGANNSSKKDSLAQIQLGAIVSAALCRGVAANPNQWGDIVHYKSNCPYPWNYYPSGVQSDLYSKVIHQYSIDSKNYGFPYDDYFDDEAGFTVLPGDNVHVNILPLTGTMKALPNGPIPQQKGCLLLTVPVDTIYPSSATWNVGTMYVEKERVTAGSNKFCLLPNDTIQCSFSSKPSVTLNVFSQPQNGGLSYYSFVDTSRSSFKVNGITNMTYDSTQFNLTFSNAANWTYAGAWSVTLPGTYPSGGSWKIGTMYINGQPLASGLNSNLINTNPAQGDTLICTFSNQPNLQLCLIKNKSFLFRNKDHSKCNIIGISNMIYDSTNCTVVFGSNGIFQYLNSWSIILPGSYPSGGTWKIGTISVNGKALVSGDNSNLIEKNLLYGDTLICTFSTQPNLQMCLILNSPPIFRMANGSQCPVTGIVGLSNAAILTRSIAFGATANWIPQ